MPFLHQCRIKPRLPEEEWNGPLGSQSRGRQSGMLPVKRQVKQPLLLMHWEPGRGGRRGVIPTDTCITRPKSVGTELRTMKTGSNSLQRAIRDGHRRQTNGNEASGVEAALVEVINR